MIELRVEPGVAAARALAAIKALSWDHPGAERLKLLVGERELLLGPEWCYSGDEQCMAMLAEFGEPSFAGAWPLLRAELWALNLSEEFVLFGSAPLLLAGLRDSIGDIDLFVTPAAFDRLQRRGWQLVTRDAEHPAFLERFGLGEGLTVHAFQSWREDEPIIDAWEALCEREDRAGWPCAPLALILRHKLAAIEYRGIRYAAGKHVEDAAVISRHLRALARGPLTPLQSVEDE